MKKLAILAVIVLPVLSGCVPIILGAAAGGATGYYITHDDHK